MPGPKPLLAARAAALTAVVLASAELLVIGGFGPSETAIETVVGSVVAATLATLVRPGLERLARARPVERPLTPRGFRGLLVAYALVGVGAAVEGALWLPRDAVLAIVLFADTAVVLTLVALARRIVRRRCPDDGLD